MSGTTKKKEEETAVSSVTEGTTMVLGKKIGIGSEYRGSIDLLAALQLHNTTYNGVKQVPGGLYRLKPTYNLDGESFSTVRLFVRGILETSKRGFKTRTQLRLSVAVSSRNEK